MALYLTENATGTNDRATVEAVVERLSPTAQEAGGCLLDVQVSVDLGRIFFVAEDVDPSRLEAGIADLGVERTTPALVRLVGATVEAVRARAGGPASYLVEWDFPTGLDMDTYLARKKEKAPLYAKVPEVAFLRTYVREDMGKCLCLYDAPDDEAVIRARQAVSSPSTACTASPARAIRRHRGSGHDRRAGVRGRRAAGRGHRRVLLGARQGGR
jgi:hypothetical protein